ncbi:hypothetical protein EZV73_03250 [Acidaminobacter sp. JC074]|uniref:hypothetical protein n=1 Tax=Acidaminobacter sp. JC074 TaxID=2530199 RepID=UPI001F10853E|nr:hypothetical protein [Acidaminobacter sp. JC074]MCH4886566.1 hypothetical protein [Acidaminobacter sp. JC074]
MHIVVSFLVVILMTTLFYMGHSLREDNIPFEWCHSEDYNITYKKSYLNFNNEKILCYQSNDKNKYIAILKARTILFLEGGNRIVLRWRSRDEIITLGSNDEKKILEMLKSMNDLASKDQFILPIRCKEGVCDSCNKYEVCKKRVAN